MPSKPFAATAAQLAAYRALLAAEAEVDRIRPIVRGYQVEILARHEWRPDPTLADLADGVTLIREHKDTWLLSTENGRIFDAACEAARVARGDLPVSTPGFCPLLSAEVARMDAERELIDAIADVTGVQWARFKYDFKLLGPYLDAAKRLFAAYLQEKAPTT